MTKKEKLHLWSSIASLVGIPISLLGLWFALFPLTAPLPKTAARYIIASVCALPLTYFSVHGFISIRRSRILQNTVSGQAQQNDKLASEIRILQEQIVRLTNENGRLSQERQSHLQDIARLQRELRGLEAISSIIHRINHEYRDVLSENFRRADRLIVNPTKEILDCEQTTLSSVCQKLARLFSKLIGSECFVSVKLITEFNGKFVCETFVRSEQNCERDQGPWKHFKFELNTDANTGYDRALQYKQGDVSAFVCNDLTTLTGYRNQRDNWHRFYRSTIVVPVRYVNVKNLGKPGASDDVGFLCLDSLEIASFNQDHVHLLAGFADQLYNFMSIMRGRYRLEHSGPQSGGSELDRVTAESS